MAARLPTRRDLVLRSASAACAALAVPWLPFSLSTGAEGRSGMLARPIPQSNEPLPVVGIGTWQTFDVGSERTELDQRKEVLRTLFAAGGRVIDSSPMYGRAEAVVGSLLAEMDARDKAFLATKVWTTGEAAGIAQMEASFAKLQARTIDLMQIHNLVDWRTHLRTLRTWKEQKRLRYIGITHYTVPSLEELAAIIRAEQIDFVQCAYSINVRGADARLLPVAAEKGVAVVVNQPFDSGALFRKVRGRALPGWASEFDCASWGQFFLKFILGHPSVTCVIPGTAKPEHARDNVAAGMGRLPDQDQRRRMAAFWDSL
ncbi:MAG: aldo/keto reductase [Hyphomicrobiaceae bacterium]|nr:MAG: aldo/keto reductase [Hyphomicrobiaceae bacterium]